MLRERQYVITMQGTCSHMELLMFRYERNHFRIEGWFKPLLTEVASLLLHYKAISQVAWMERPKNRHDTENEQSLSDEYSMTVASGLSEK